MNTGAFGEGFPYSNFHDLNMDWIIKIAKDFLDQYTNIQQIISDGETSLTELTNAGLEQLEEKTTELTNALDAWYNEHSEDIANQLVQALADLNTWYTQHQGYLNQYLENSVEEFERRADAKAESTIATIPEDYTNLSNAVTALSAIKIPPEKTTFFEGITNLFDPNDETKVATGYYDRTNTFVPNNIVHQTGLIPVIPQKYYSFLESGAGFVLWYSEKDNSTYIGYTDYAANARKVQAPNGAYYGRFIFLAANEYAYRVNEGETLLSYTPYKPYIPKKYLYYDLLPINPTDTTFFDIGTNLFNQNDPDVSTNGYYDRTNTFQSSTVAGMTGYIPVTPAHNYSFGPHSAGFVLWFDNNKRYLTYTDYDTSTVYVTALNDAFYVKIIFEISDVSHFIVNEGTTRANYVPYHTPILDEEYLPEICQNAWNELEGVAFGTSLTYRSQSTGGYLQYLPTISGVNFDNQGIGNATILVTSDYPDLDILASIKAYTNYANKNVCILEGFVNDWFRNHNKLGEYTDTGETTVCGCVRSAINYIQSQNANIAIFLVLDHYGTGVNASTAVNGSNITQYTYYSEISKVAKSMGIPVIALYEESNMNENTPQFYIDNIHPTAIGARQSAYAIWSKMKQFYPLQVSQ